eukprot:IDg5593t1
MSKRRSTCRIRCSARKSETLKARFRVMRLPGKLKISTRTLKLVQQGQL